MLLHNRFYLVFVFILLLISPVAQAKEYDGIWFLGFNLNKKGCASKNFRRAVSYALSADKIIPGSIVPPGMKGYDKSLKPPRKNIKRSFSLLKKTRHPKKINLLHTDGVKTIQIVKRIKKDLSKVGIKVISRKITYADEGKWEKVLARGRYDLFLMGYKAEDSKNTATLLKPLFSSKGEANFCHYRSPRMDRLIKTKKFKEANQVLYNNRVIIPLFYITKL